MAAKYSAPRFSKSRGSGAAQSQAPTQRKRGNLSREDAKGRKREKKEDGCRHCNSGKRPGKERGKSLPILRSWESRRKSPYKWQGNPNPATRGGSSPVVIRGEGCEKGKVDQSGCGAARRDHSREHVRWSRQVVSSGIVGGLIRK